MHLKDRLVQLVQAGPVNLTNQEILVDPYFLTALAVQAIPCFPLVLLNLLIQEFLGCQLDQGYLVVLLAQHFQQVPAALADHLFLAVRFGLYHQLDPVARVHLGVHYLQRVQVLL